MNIQSELEYNVKKRCQILLQCTAGKDFKSLALEDPEIVGGVDISPQT